MSEPAVRTTEVFTPNQQAKLNFIARPDLEDRLYDALRTPGRQIIVYGHSGSGKSSLLSKKLTEVYSDHITTRCIDDMTFEQVMLDAFDQLDIFFEETTNDSTAKTRDGSLDAQYGAIRLAIQKSSEITSGTESRRLIPPQLTAQRLAKFMGAKNLCWVLEDFHKVHPTQKKLLAQAMKVFVDESYHFPTLRVIAVGAVATAREVVEHDPEMRTRVSELLVPLMEDAELQLILSQGESLLNVQFSRDQKDDIVRFSNGLAAICHDLSLTMCQVADVEHASAHTVSFTTEIFRRAIQRYVQNSSDTLRAMFEKALRRDRVRKYDNTRLILKAIAAGTQDGMMHGQILAEIQKTHPDYPAANLTAYLAELQSPKRGGLIRLNISTNCYAFSDPLFQAYARAALLPLEVQSNNVASNLVEGVDLLEAIRRLLALQVPTRLFSSPGASDASATDTPRVRTLGEQLIQSTSASKEVFPPTSPKSD